jgi:signal peptidase II
VEDSSTAAESRGTRQLLAATGIAALVLAVDQIAKWLVADKLGPGASSHRYRLLGDLFGIQYVENRGVAFGLLQGQVFLVTVLAIAVVFFLVRLYRRAGTASWTMAIGCGLIVGGAIGNLVDRVRFGYVVDFIGVSGWPRFNVADGAITIGALLLAWRYLRDDESEEIEQRNSGSTVPPALVVLNRDGDR